MIIAKRTKRFLKKMYLKGVILGYHGQRRGKDNFMIITKRTKRFLNKMYFKDVILGYHGQRRGKDKL